MNKNPINKRLENGREDMLKKHKTDEIRNSRIAKCRKKHNV